MRVILAGLFVFGGALLAVCLLGPVFDHRPPAVGGILIGLVMGTLFLVLIAIAQVLFNWPIVKGRDWGDPEQYIKDLEEKGLLVSADYQATRAFQLAEYEDEGSHYFVELADGSVMYFVGQYLYEYGPIDDEDNDPETNHTRRFPCTEFSLRRHRDENYWIDIQCRGEVIEPELVEPHPKLFWKREMEDGQIITDMSFDEIRVQLTSEGKRK